MKQKMISLKVLFAILLLIITIGCGKEEETNQLPTCEITAPIGGAEITKGENIIISVKADDTDGNIVEVLFFVDGVGKNSVSSFPFVYNWNTTNENIDVHLLKATSIDNNGGSSSDEITVTIIENSENVPVANFAANITNGTTPLTVTFSDQSTNTPTSWQWEFGDGSASTLQNPSYSYNNVGTYTVMLTATNEFGTDTETKTDYIVVTEAGSAPVADFTGNPTSGTAPLTVNFTDQSNNTPTSWQWEFGDGITSTIQNPVHTYNTDGSYSVSLTVSNDYGTDIKTISSYIYVGSGGGGCEGQTNLTYSGQTYEIVEIGNQCWMAENLNYETANSWTYYDNPGFGDIFGRLYTWEAALTACPSGWSLPSDDKWKQMEIALGMSQSEADDTGFRGTDEGGKMKETGTTHWDSPNTGATNTSGFNAFAGGLRYINGTFGNIYDYGAWWSSSEYSDTRAWHRDLRYDHDQVFRGKGYKGNGFSVRCLKN